MKIFKKTAAALAAAAMTLVSLSVPSYAEDMYKVYVDAPKASVGETVEAKVVIDAGSTAVGGVSFKLNYDPVELECVSVVLGEEFSALGFTGSFYPDEAKSLIGFAYTTGGSGFSNRSVDLILVYFKVLKPNANLTLSDVVAIGDDFDSTKLTGAAEDAVVKCSHKNTEIKTTPATCKDDGKDETVCKDCGAVLKTDPIAATGEHSWTEEITKQPTCTENGSKTLACTVCGEIKPVDIPSLGHDWDNGEIVTEPTCTEKGEKLFTCNRCGETKPEEVSALGHNWDEGQETTPPACTEKGEKTFACTRCTATQTEDIPALGHDWGEWAVTKPATSEEDGEESRECKLCGAAETRAIEKLPPAATTFTGHFVSPETTTTAVTAAAETTTTEAAPTTTASVTVGIIELNNEANNVKLEFASGVISEETVLHIKQVNATSTSVTFDIYLMLGGNIVQPNGTVTVKIGIPDNLTGDKFYVYRVETDGSYTDMNAEYFNGYITFKTDRFNEYIISTVQLTENTEAVTTPAETESAPTSSDSAGNTNNGSDIGSDSNQYTGVVLTIVPAIIAAAGVIIFKKRK